MATFDTLIDDLASRFGLGANARTLIREVLSMIPNSPGGFGGFLDKFKSAGLTSEVASWLGHPDASPIAAGQVERALGATALSAIAGRVGLKQAAASTALGYALPKIVGLLTPRGAVPAGVPAEVTAFLSLPRAAAAVEQVAPTPARCLSSERGERTGHPALAMAGARRAGRRWPPFLFLVDDEPDTARSARRNGAGTYDARAVGRRAGAVPASCSSAGGASARPAASAPAVAQTPAPAPQPAAPPPAPAPSTDAQATASQASPAPAAQAPAAPTSPADDPTVACHPSGASGSRHGGANRARVRVHAAPTGAQQRQWRGARVRRRARRGREDVGRRHAPRGLRRGQGKNRHPRRPGRRCGAVARRLGPRAGSAQRRQCRRNL